MLTVLLQKSRKYRLWRRLRRAKPSLDQYYFGYGANVAPDRFDKNHMHSKCAGPAVLLDHKLEFSLPCQFAGMGYGSVNAAAGEEVWGVAYKIDCLSLQLLDVLEWVNYGYYRRTKAQVQLRDTREIVESWVYMATCPQAGLMPSTEYLDVIIRNAKSAGYPEKFIKHLESTRHQPLKDFEINFGFRITDFQRARPFVRQLGRLYRWHDRLRHKLMVWLP